jgi:hypothetical protein
MQIVQFLVGAILAALHLFVQYDVPVANPYKLFATASTSVASTISGVSSASIEVHKVIDYPLAFPFISALTKE